MAGWGWGSGGLADEDAAGLEIGERSVLLSLGDTDGPDDRPIGENGIAQDRRDLDIDPVRRSDVEGSDADGLGGPVERCGIEGHDLVVAGDLDGEAIAGNKVGGPVGEGD